MHFLLILIATFLCFLFSCCCCVFCFYFLVGALFCCFHSVLVVFLTSEWPFPVLFCYVFITMLILYSILSFRSWSSATSTIFGNDSLVWFLLISQRKPHQIVCIATWTGVLNDEACFLFFLFLFLTSIILPDDCVLNKHTCFSFAVLQYFFSFTLFLLLLLFFFLPCLFLVLLILYLFCSAFEVSLIFTLLLYKVFHLFIYFFILLKKMWGTGGGGNLRSWCLGTTWECSEGDGVRNFEYIGPADTFDCARLSWPMCPVGKWLPGTAFPGWDQILEWSLDWPIRMTGVTSCTPRSSNCWWKSNLISPHWCPPQTDLSKKLVFEFCNEPCAN